MKTNVNTNSIIAYKELDKELSQLEIIFQLIKKLEPVNSRGIAFVSGIERSSVVARINKLKADKRIEAAFSETCTITKKETEFYRVVKPKVVINPGTQGNLF